MPADYRQYDYISKRVRYFDAQFLKDQDFIDEQKYHLDRQRRSLRYLHVSGIVDGLTVEPGDGNNGDAKSQATIAPGTAIDQNGCQIVLVPSDPPETVGLESYRGQTVEIFISYQEIESDMAQEGSKANRRWHERPLITVVKLGDKAPLAGVRLARLNVSSSGLVTIDRNDPTVRQYAGISLPSSDNARPTLRSGGEEASNLAVLSGSLSISNNVGIGTKFPKDKLSIQGGALSFANENAVPQMGIDYDTATDTLRVRSNRDAQVLNTNLLSINRTTGNVSIGTSTTSGGLEINRGGTNDLAFSLNSSGAGWGSGLQFRNTATNARTYGIYSGSDGKWHFADVNSSSDRLVVDQVGNIGIGTIGPNARLEVKLANATTDTSLKLEHIGSNFIVRPLTAGGTSSVIENTGGGALVINPKAGNVGIGAGDPKAKLTIQTPKDYDGDTIRFESKKEPANYYLNLKTSVSDGVVQWVFDQTNLGTAYNSVLAFDRGNVGIGTNNPKTKLQVTGGNISIDYGENGYLLVDPANNWPNGTHRLIGVEWLNNTDTVKLYTPGSQRKDPIMTLDANGNIMMGTSGTTANIDLTGHIQLKEYGMGGIAYLQARDDNSNRDIGLRFRTQTKGSSSRQVIEAMTINPDGNIDIVQKPIEITKYSNIGDDTNYNTGYSTSNWLCTIAGFHSGVGDINEKDSGEIIKVYAYPNSNGYWHIRADFRTHNVNENWTIWLMAIRTGFAKATNAL
ncbi:hypothetical protein H6F90_02800 [Trichocoleus sp. FACHB-591]|uniref:hypothetical protein n=1 Tax=Trichocoleus sp. FACHB-591 TaxID=2692872 RepID=UPI001685C36A|nr:hypothetical protein [Trichocoleus sp. FACHB-591]MBD2094082.1 hypothetical protein [Trichocoleus sp. FACHB-591]